MYFVYLMYRTLKFLFSVVCWGNNAWQIPGLTVQRPNVTGLQNQKQRNPWIEMLWKEKKRVVKKRIEKKLKLDLLAHRTSGQT